MVAMADCQGSDLTRLISRRLYNATGRRARSLRRAHLARPGGADEYVPTSCSLAPPDDKHALTFLLSLNSYLRSMATLGHYYIRHRPIRKKTVKINGLKANARTDPCGYKLHSTPPSYLAIVIRKVRAIFHYRAFYSVHGVIYTIN